MRHKLLRENGVIKTKSLLISLLFAFFISPFFVSPYLFSAFTSSVEAASKKPESPKDAILVKGYEWKSGGMGRAAIIKEITLENKGKKDYKNIEVEINLYTTNDIPLGSLRSTIHDVVESGTEKTFYDVNFGIMHSELERTVPRIVRAEVVEKGPPSLPRDLILVKNWEWTGAQYGTEGILKEITLENRGGNHYKDIKIRVNNLGIGERKVGAEGFTTIAVIHDVLPAKSTKTFKNVNVGFRYPDTRESYIGVVDAKLISTKEVKYRLAEKGVKVKEKRVAKKSEEKSERQAQSSEETETEEGPKLTLAERYRQKLAKKTEQGSTPPTGEVTEPSVETSKESEPLKEEVVAAPPEDEETAATQAPKEEEVEEKGEEEEYTSEEGILGKVSKKVSEFGESVVGLFKGDSEEAEEEDSTPPSKKEEPSKGEAEVTSTEGEGTTVLEIPEGEEEEEEAAIPKDDIMVKNFTWGGGITGTMGVLQEITLENRSGITYTNIQLIVEFYSGSIRRPLGSNRVTIYEVLPANSEKAFQNVKVGFLSTIPEEVDIRVVDAVAVR